MRELFGGQQSDAWLKNRIGRITGSRIADVCSYLTRTSGDKKAGDSSKTRDSYLEELISERLTGYAKDHYNSPAMQRGSALEADARRCYAAAMDSEVTHVGFVLHPKYDFSGASADSLIDDDGVLEIKCLLPWNHIHYVRRQEIPEEYIPQIAWEMACAERRYCDFVLYCPDIQGTENERLRFFYRRMVIEDLTWEVGKDVLKGQAVIDYFTAEVLKMEAEIQAFMVANGCKPIAPYPVELVEEASSAPINATDDEFVYLDRMEMTP